MATNNVELLIVWASSDLASLLVVVLGTRKSFHLTTGFSSEAHHRKGELTIGSSCWCSVHCHLLLASVTIACCSRHLLSTTPALQVSEVGWCVMQIQLRNCNLWGMQTSQLEHWIPDKAQLSRHWDNLGRAPPPRLPRHLENWQHPRSFWPCKFLMEVPNVDWRFDCGVVPRSRTSRHNTLARTSPGGARLHCIFLGRPLHESELISQLPNGSFPSLLSSKTSGHGSQHQVLAKTAQSPELGEVRVAGCPLPLPDSSGFRCGVECLCLLPWLFRRLQLVLLVAYVISLASGGICWRFPHCCKRRDKQLLVISWYANKKVFWTVSLVALKWVRHALKVEHFPDPTKQCFEFSCTFFVPVLCLLFLWLSTDSHHRFARFVPEVMRASLSGPRLKQFSVARLVSHRELRDSLFFKLHCGGSSALAFRIFLRRVHEVAAAD